MRDHLYHVCECACVSESETLSHPHLHRTPVAGIRHVSHEDGVTMVGGGQQEVSQALLAAWGDVEGLE